MSLSADVLATRFGYGLPLATGTPNTPDDMLAALTGPDHMQAAYPLPSRTDYEPQMRAMIDAIRTHKNDPKNTAVKKVQNRLDLMVDKALRTSVARALDAADPFRERLVAFWTNHFCTRAKGRPATYLPALMIEEAIRPNLAGKFADLLFASTTHPAMVLYLDQNLSFGPNSRIAKRFPVGLNENLGREVMELHSLGVGAPYTQHDVRQMSRLLTGLTYNMKNGRSFERGRVEPGPETVLGRVYTPGNGLEPIRAVLTDIAARPETAHHISTQLARHFVADTPPPALVTAMAYAYLRSGGDLVAVYEAMLNSPAAATPPGAKVRWPIDYIPTGLRSLGLAGSDVMAMKKQAFNHAVPKALQAMGMPFLQPAGPNGFPDTEDAWINPPFLAARVTWSMNLANLVLTQAPDPVALAQTALGERATPAFLNTVSHAETRLEAVGLVLASSAMNRR